MLKMVFTGVGGQGIITAGIIMAEAAVVEENRYATQSQSYGAEARGGLTRTDVIISSREVIYPKIEQAHILAALHQRGYASYTGCLRPGGILIYDEDSVDVDDKTDARKLPMPILKAGRGANITLLGIICALSGAVAPDAVLRVIEKRYGTGSANSTAFEQGLKLVSDRGLLSMFAETGT